MAKRDSKLGVSVPDGEPKEKLRVSEWDVDPKNNRIYDIDKAFQRQR